MQHLDKTLALKHTLATCMYMQYPDLLLQYRDETLATYI
jgi:hypothetical protein